MTSELDGTPDPAPGATTPPSEPTLAAELRTTGAGPMWVLGLVVMVDQIDQNIVRGVVPN